MKKYLITSILVFALVLGGCGQIGSENNTEEIEENNVDGGGDSVGTTEEDREYEEYVYKLTMKSDNYPQLEEPQKGDTIAIIKTNMGDVKLRFFPEQAPKTVENFLTHAENGYYDGMIFHRVINGFMIQGGAPDGLGYTGESIWGEDFEDEFSHDLYNFRGALSMANRGPDTNSSQFFIVQSKTMDQAYADYIKDVVEQYGDEQLLYNNETGKLLRVNYTENNMDKYSELGGAAFLDYQHTVFGQVYEGMDIVDCIAAVKVGENDKPVEDVIIESIEVGVYK